MGDGSEADRFTTPGSSTTGATANPWAAAGFNADSHLIMYGAEVVDGASPQTS